MIRIVDHATIRAAVRFTDLIEPMARAFRESSAGLADNGLIVMFPAEQPDLGDVYVKTGVLRGHDHYIVKVAPWFLANASAGVPQGGFIGVFNAHTGQTVALLDERHYLSDIRTAAAGAVAARLLAPAAIESAAVLGSGTQAFWQPQALYRERPFRRLRLWARNPARCEALRQRLAIVLPDVAMLCSDNLERTVREADVILTATVAREPLVRGAWLRPGQHLTAVGADDPSKCELDAEALERARVFVDARATATANGDIHHAIAAGRYRAEQVAGELGEVIAGTIPGRTASTDITIAKLVGIGAQDLVASETTLDLVDRLEPAGTSL